MQDKERLEERKKYSKFPLKELDTWTKDFEDDFEDVYVDYITPEDEALSEAFYKLIQSYVQNAELSKQVLYKNSLNNYFEIYCLGKEKGKISTTQKIFYDFDCKDKYRNYGNLVATAVLSTGNVVRSVKYNTPTLVKTTLKKLFEGNFVCHFERSCNFYSGQKNVSVGLSSFSSATKNYENSAIDVALLNSKEQVTAVCAIDKNDFEEKFTKLLKNYETSKKENWIRIPRQKINFLTDVFVCNPQKTLPTMLGYEHFEFKTSKKELIKSYIMGFEDFETKEMVLFELSPYYAHVINEGCLVSKNFCLYEKMREFVCLNALHVHSYYKGLMSLDELVGVLKDERVFTKSHAEIREYYCETSEDFFIKKLLDYASEDTKNKNTATQKKIYGIRRMLEELFAKCLLWGRNENQDYVFAWIKKIKDYLLAGVFLNNQKNDFQKTKRAVNTHLFNKWIDEEDFHHILKHTVEMVKFYYVNDYFAFGVPNELDLSFVLKEYKKFKKRFFEFLEKENCFGEWKEVEKMLLDFFNVVLKTNLKKQS